jgi:hypothetical protein
MHFHARISDGQTYTIQMGSTSEDTAQQWIVQEMTNHLNSTHDTGIRRELRGAMIGVMTGDYEGPMFTLTTTDGKHYTYESVTGDWCEPAGLNCYGMPLTQ